MCASCDSGRYLKGDGTCALKACTCSNGTGATGTSCPSNGNAKCKSCNRGYKLSGGSCGKIVNCQWSGWSDWSECSSCHDGTQTATRTVAVKAQNGGKGCSGKSSKSQDCSPGCSAFWTGCYSHHSCSKGLRDKCIKAKCKAKGLSMTDFERCSTGWTDWYSKFKGHCT